MANLKVMDLYERTNDANIDQFKENVNSTLKVITNYESVACNYEWLDLMEDTVHYLDNILRNPNKFIVNEEDVIKIELAKRVTVESIKHLSRNTNLIQDYNKKTGDVKPSKILNITKEESFDTYENRFIYTLIQNMKYYINNKKQNSVVASSLKDYKKLEYNGTANVGKEKVNINMSLDTNLDTKGTKGENAIEKRIEALEEQIADLCGSSVYRDIDKLHITLITPPIKKTNVIIKNVNFQYAMKLWTYMQDHVDDDTARNKKNDSYEDNGKLKEYVDETFLLNYLTAKNINEESDDVSKEELSEKLVENMVKKVMDVNKNYSLEDIQKMVGDKYTVIKYRNVVSDKKIMDIFKEKVEDYLERIENFEF